MGELFDAGSAGFTAWSSRLWEPLGEALVRLGAPQPGERALDACCGTGASALPAALAVGPTGWVDGVDLADRLLDQARRNAARRGLDNVRFSCADVTTWQGAPYDLVQCGYGVHLLPDMTAGARHLVSLLRGGGRLAVATGGVGVFQPLLGLVDQAVARERGDESLAVPPRPSDRINTPDKLRGWMETLGVRVVDIAIVPFTVTLDSPELTWALVTGSALRFLLTGLGPEAVARVRADVLGEIHHGAEPKLDVPTLIAVGRAPG